MWNVSGSDCTWFTEAFVVKSLTNELQLCWEACDLAFTPEETVQQAWDYTQVGNRGGGCPNVKLSAPDSISSLVPEPCRKEESGSCT